MYKLFKFAFSLRNSLCTGQGHPTFPTLTVCKVPVSCVSATQLSLYFPVSESLQGFHPQNHPQSLTNMKTASESDPLSPFPTGSVGKQKNFHLPRRSPYLKT